MIRLALLAATAAAPALAQNAPSFDCARAESAAEKLVCADPALAGMDRRLADHYAAALAVAAGLDAGAAEATATLKATQRGWVKGRDDCWKADDLRACVEDAYAIRSGELVALWMLETPSAQVLWRCGGDPAHEVAVTHFAAERPSLRLERGDSVAFAVQTPAASGARYEGAFGMAFWEKGAEATLEWPQGETVACARD